VSIGTRQLGLSDYRDIWGRMQAYTEGRDGDAADEIWLLQHYPVYTLGLAGRREHLLDPGDIPVIDSDRGGQVTYHGPGQLVAYVLLDLRRHGLGIRALVRLLEQVLIDLLAEYDIAAGRRAGAPGVYVGGAKIAALGLRVRRGCSYHGLALNVDMDLEPFSRIDPCGYPGLAVTQMRDCGCDAGLEAVSRRLLQHLQAALGPGDGALPPPVPVMMTALTRA